MVFIQAWQATRALKPQGRQEEARDLCQSRKSQRLSAYRCATSTGLSPFPQPEHQYLSSPAARFSRARAFLILPDGSNSHSFRANNKMHEPATSNSADGPLSPSVNDETKPSVPMQSVTGRIDSRSKVYHTGWRLYALTARYLKVAFIWSHLRELTISQSMCQSTTLYIGDNYSQHFTCVNCQCAEGI